MGPDDGMVVGATQQKLDSYAHSFLICRPVAQRREMPARTDGKTDGRTATDREANFAPDRQCLLLKLPSLALSERGTDPPPKAHAREQGLLMDEFCQAIDVRQSSPSDRLRSIC